MNGHDTKFQPEEAYYLPIMVQVHPSRDAAPFFYALNLVGKYLNLTYKLPW